MSQPTYINTSNGTVYAVTTGIAAALNLLILLMLCFIVMPRMDRTIAEMEKTHQQLLVNHAAIKEVGESLGKFWGELEQHRAVIRRLTQILDDAAAKAAKAKKMVP